MSEMVERVARAICEKSYSESGLDLPWYWTSETGDERDEWRRMARAAIEAMREPTDDMLDAASGTFPQSAFDHDYERYMTIKRIWQAMIKDALHD